MRNVIKCVYNVESEAAVLVVVGKAGERVFFQRQEDVLGGQVRSEAYIVVGKSLVSPMYAERRL